MIITMPITVTKYLTKSNFGLTLAHSLRSHSPLWWEYSDEVTGLTAAELGSRERRMLAFLSLSAFYSAQDAKCPGSD